MNSVGNTLRTERVRVGLKLEEVTTMIKVARHFLEAMENDQFDRLPGRFFAFSFLRQYAHILGLDDDELIGSFQRGLVAVPEPLPAPPPRRPWFRLPEVLMPLWLAVGMLACVGLYSWWHTGQWRALSGTLAPAKGSAARVVPEPAISARGTEVTQLPAVVAEPASVRSAPGIMRVAFGARAPVWVSVTSDGVETYSGTLEEQQTKEFDASKVMRVLVGNAAALVISLNGKPVPLNGRQGQVQLLELTLDGVRVVTRTSAPELPSEDHL